jgi:regulator of sigma E protease
MLSILAPVLVFGLVIFVHELGHFLAAKAVGVYAPRFSIGFGPTLWRHRWGETEYVLAALPLGGYVRMASRLDEDIAFLEGGSEESKAVEASELDPNALRPFGPLPVPENRLFENKPLLARLLILISGVTMNVVLAIVVFTGLALSYGRPVVSTRVIGSIDTLATAPALARLATGDTVRAVNGQPVASWNAVIERAMSSDSAVVIATNREEVRVPVNGKGQPSAEQVARALNYGYFVPPVIDSVIPGEPAAGAGFVAGDSVVSIQGEPVREWGDLVRIVNASPGRALTFDIVRKGAPHSIAVVPKSTEAVDQESGKTTHLGKIGAAPRDLSHSEPVGVGRAVATGAQLTWAEGLGVIDVVKKLLLGQLSVSQLGGPIAITRASVEAARRGLKWLFGLIAFLSVNVAVLNLFPIPILDGGQILINIIESAKGSPFSLRTREYILRFGLVAIALLFVTVMYNDTRSGLARVVGWIAKLFS